MRSPSHRNLNSRQVLHAKALIVLRDKVTLAFTDQRQFRFSLWLFSVRACALTVLHVTPARALN